MTGREEEARRPAPCPGSRRPSPRRGERPPGDRGTVLVLAVMVMLVLSAIAFVAVQAAVNQMARVGSYRVSTVSKYITQAGSEATIAVAAYNPGGFEDLVKSRNWALTMADVSPGFFDMNSDGSFGREVATMSTANWATMLDDPGTPLDDPVSVPAVAGYEAGSYCFRKFDAKTDGFYRHDVPEALPDVHDELLRVIERNAQKRFEATLLVGPVQCN